jgi:hypothetical protein
MPIDFARQHKHCLIGSHFADQFTGNPRAAALGGSVLPAHLVSPKNG